jgi:hypothetical protein
MLILLFLVKLAGRGQPGSARLLQGRSAGLPPRPETVRHPKRLGSSAQRRWAGRWAALRDHRPAARAPLHQLRRPLSGLRTEVWEAAAITAARTLSVTGWFGRRGTSRGTTPRATVRILSIPGTRLSSQCQAERSARPASALIIRRSWGVQVLSDDAPAVGWARSAEVQEAISPTAGQQRVRGDLGPNQSKAIADQGRPGDSRDMLAIDLARSGHSVCRSL